MIAVSPPRVRQHRARANRRSRVPEQRQSGRPHAQGQAGPAGLREIVARLAGWLARLLVRHAPRAGASPPQRTAARRRCAPSPLRPPPWTAHDARRVRRPCARPQRDRAGTERSRYGASAGSDQEFNALSVTRHDPRRLELHHHPKSPFSAALNSGRALTGPKYRRGGSDVAGACFSARRQRRKSSLRGEG